MTTQFTDWAIFAAPPPASWSWGIILFFFFLGLIIALSPARRTYDFKKRKDE